MISDFTMDLRLIEPDSQRRFAVYNDDLAPWIKLLPDPDPPTPAKLGGALRERAPSVHEEVASLTAHHRIAEQDRILSSMIWRLFYTIAEWLPTEIVVALSPAPQQVDPATEGRAVQLLTRSRRWQPRVRPRSSFPWPSQEVYEFSDSLLPRSRRYASEALRMAAQAAYQLFVRVAVALAEMFEHCWVDPATLRGFRRRIV